MNNLLEVNKHFWFLPNKERLRYIAQTYEPVIISGESGSGKSFLAEAIHKDSISKEGHCESIALSAIPEALFESILFGHMRGAFTDAKDSRIGILEYCNGGTIILEDITEVSLINQPKLLSFLDTQRVRRVGQSSSKAISVRIVVTTNQNIAEKISEGKFREDLFHRLNSGYTYRMPSLVQLDNEVVRNILKEMVDTKRQALNLSTSKVLIQNSCVNELRNRTNGNFRALQKMATSLVFKEDTAKISRDHVVDAFGITIRSSDKKNDANSLPKTLKEVTYNVIKETYRQCSNNQVKTAEYLGISRNTLRTHMKACGLIS